MTDQEYLEYYKNKIAETGSMTTQQWDHYKRVYKRIDPEGYIKEKEYSRVRYLTKQAEQLTTEQLQSIIDSRK